MDTKDAVFKQKLMTALLENPGATNVELAASLGVSTKTIARKLILVDANEFESVTDQEVQTLTRSSVIKAISVANSLMDDEDPRLRLAAASAILRFLKPNVADSKEDKNIEYVYETQWGSKAEP